MRLIFLGTGSAFTVGGGNYQSNMVLEADAKDRLLIDCGTDARLALYEMGLGYRDIQDVYVSHLHADHVGGLEWLALTSKYDPSCKKPHLHLHHAFVETLWNHTLSGGIGSSKEGTDSLEAYFQVDPVKEDLFFWKGIAFRLIPAQHALTGCNHTLSYGLYFEIGGKNILITGDSQFAPDRTKKYYAEADVIFQDCETSQARSGVHAHYTELVTLSPQIKNKMWLYHYQSGPLPDAKADGFQGFVKKGQAFDFFK